MSPAIAGAAFALWFATVLGAYLYGVHEADEEWELREATASVNQERRNVRMLDNFLGRMERDADNYRRNPPVVRVRYKTPLPSECPEPPPPDPKDIVLTVGGVKRGDRGAAAR